MNFSWQIDSRTIKQIQTSLKEFDTKLKKKIIRDGARQWGKDTIQTIRNNMTWQEKDLKKAVKMRVKTLRKNRGIWIGVGIESSKKVGKGVDTYWAATKARWYNDGWTPYPKGRKSGRKGKGWRNGLRGQGGQKIYQTHFMDLAAQQQLPKLPDYIIEAIQSVIKGTK